MDPGIFGWLGAAILYRVPSGKGGWRGGGDGVWQWAPHHHQLGVMEGVLYRARSGAKPSPSLILYARLGQSVTSPESKKMPIKIKGDSGSPLSLSPV